MKTVIERPVVEEIRAKSAAEAARGWRPVMELLGAGSDALAPLRTQGVAVIGTGSVGGSLAVKLARLGLGKLLLIDPKNFKRQSLATHEIGPAEVGKGKAWVAGLRCKAVNPRMRVLVFAAGVEALALAALAGVDLAVMAPDLLPAEVETAQRCLWAGIPLLHASVHGPTLTAHVRTFLNAGSAGPCPVCAYGPAERDLLARQVRFSCDGSVRDEGAAPATNSISPLCSLAADLAAMQIVRLLLKIGPPVADRVLEYNGFTHRTVISPLARNPKCPLEHMVFRRASLKGPLETFSLSDIARQAAGEGVPAGAQFEVEGFEWVEQGECGCGPKPVRRFAAGMLPRCPKCAQRPVPLSFHAWRVMSTGVLGAAMDQPLRRLGAGRATSVVLRTGESGLLITGEENA